MDADGNEKLQYSVIDDSGILEQESIKNEVYELNPDWTSLEEIYTYYSQDVLFEIVKQTRGKELALLSPQYKFRCIKAHNFSYLMNNLDNMGFFKRQMNMYYSTCNFENMPQFSYLYTLRKKQQQDFTKNVDRYAVGHNIAIDLDAHYQPLEKVYDKFVMLIKLFDEDKVPYSPRFSGNGFHIYIPFEYYPDGIVWQEFAGEFLKEIKRFLSLPSLDCSTGDLRSLLKIPYSLDVKTGNVCYPLAPEEIEGFDVAKMNWTYIKKHKIIKNRGIMMRTGNKDTFHKFLKRWLW